jgi:ribonuclease HI
MYFDGGCRPSNPGNAGCGVVLKITRGKLVQTIPVARELGWKTNNEAEYIGLIVGLKIALEQGVTEIDIRTDSKLVEGQCNGWWKVKDPKLKALVSDALDLLEQFDKWKITWGRRNANTEADALSTMAIMNTLARNHNANPWRVKLKGKMVVKKLPDPFQH